MPEPTIYRPDGDDADRSRRAVVKHPPAAGNDLDPWTTTVVTATLLSVGEVLELDLEALAVPHTKELVAAYDVECPVITIALHVFDDVNAADNSGSPTIGVSTVLPPDVEIELERVIGVAAEAYAKLAPAQPSEAWLVAGGSPDDRATAYGVLSGIVEELVG